MEWKASELLRRNYLIDYSAENSNDVKHIFVIRSSA